MRMGAELNLLAIAAPIAAPSSRYSASVVPMRRSSLPDHDAKRVPAPRPRVLPVSLARLEQAPVTDCEYQMPAAIHNA